MTTIVLSIAADMTTPRRSWRRPRSPSGFGSRTIGFRSAGCSRAASCACGARSAGHACASAWPGLRGGRPPPRRAPRLRVFGGGLLGRRFRGRLLGGGLRGDGLLGRRLRGGSLLGRFPASATTSSAASSSAGASSAGRLLDLCHDLGFGSSAGSPPGQLGLGLGTRLGGRSTPPRSPPCLVVLLLVLLFLSAILGLPSLTLVPDRQDPGDLAFCGPDARRVLERAGRRLETQVEAPGGSRSSSSSSSLVMVQFLVFMLPCYRTAPLRASRTSS